ncbi:alanine racemase [Aestuariibacter sp. A3R04]|uniref:alanine racemase n=1 Tax=Aestuariibacter sp. A3R04 TaxID=2841571 RepID=UPI001C095D4F|nr:alanine racemase [Aestuariibacter sp. A3R04]MBU3023363.1 alanine racemase [Aestuariibacter sp. A3R04]
MSDFSHIVTPACLIDKAKLAHNAKRLQTVCEAQNIKLRAHVKTLKSVEAAALYAPLPSPITVSTLAEARYFAEAGYKDILYAVGLTPNKYEAVNGLMERGVDITVIIDSLAAAESLTSHSRRFIGPLNVLVEIDVDNHRAGIAADSEQLLKIVTQLNTDNNIVFRGVMTHAGASYGCFKNADRVSMAKQECAGVMAAAAILGQAGIECHTISVGSTPTALAGCEHFGATEIRAGVYATFDLVMADLGVCQRQDIALTVLTSVIGLQHDKNRVIVDAGWMALSRDKGNNLHGYGLVADREGNVLDGWYVSQTNQEHGIIRHKEGKPIPADKFAYGSLLRILPNHACATAGQFRHYQVTEDNCTVSETWKSADGW